MIDAANMRWIGFVGLLAACSGPAADGAADASVIDYTKIRVEGDDKVLIYNLVGRWFPEEEIKRLDDDSITPEVWCAREPTRLLVQLDTVEVQCDSGAPVGLPIARVERQADGVHLILRAKEGSDFKNLVFQQATGTKAVIGGSPCFPGKSVTYARFPRYELLQRQILSGRRCTQIKRDEEAALPKP